MLAPVSAGEFVRDHLPHATMVMLNATGHCPSLSAPDETADAIARFLKTLSR
jgi:sigma-B regulation protein RsbQ